MRIHGVTGVGRPELRITVRIRNDFSILRITALFRICSPSSVVMGEIRLLIDAPLTTRTHTPDQELIERPSTLVTA